MGAVACSRVGFEAYPAVTFQAQYGQTVSSSKLPLEFGISSGPSFWCSHGTFAGLPFISRVNWPVRSRLASHDVLFSPSSGMFSVSFTVEPILEHAQNMGASVNVRS